MLPVALPFYIMNVVKIFLDFKGYKSCPSYRKSSFIRIVSLHVDELDLKALVSQPKATKLREFNYTMSVLNLRI